MSTPLQQILPAASPVVLGCMGFGGSWNPADPVTEDHVAQAHAALAAAREAGITMIDHADIYTHGKAERTFGELFRRQPSLRDGLLIQTKCGIRFADERGPGRYDQSRDWILTAAEASLQRLHTGPIDVLLLHRPDPLTDPAEVAEAFSRLHAAGKVRHFGVSNMHTGQLRWLQRALGTEFPLRVNQLEMGLHKTDWLDNGTCFNDGQGSHTLPWADTLQHCQSEGIQLQAWSPLSKGWFSGRLPGDAPPHHRATAERVAVLAHRHGVSREAIVLAWLMRHPAGIQPVIGTTDPERIRACAQATQVTLGREDWYSLYVAARGRPLP